MSARIKELEEEVYKLQISMRLKFESHLKVAFYKKVSYQ